MKKRIIYINLGRSSFVEKDIQILSQKYELLEFNFKQYPKTIIPISILKLLFFLFIHLRKASLVVCQFAGYHTFWPALFSTLFSGVKTLIITGGTESVSFPSIHYGNYQKKLLGPVTKYSLKWCTHIAPVHETLVYYNYTYQDKDYPAQGMKYHIKGLSTPYTVIYNGYDAQRFQAIENTPRKAKSFITVAVGIDNMMRYQLKGVDLIIALAKAKPDCTFTLVGYKNLPQAATLPDNVTVMPFVPNAELPLVFASHQFYFQLSMSEGFPNALCEAMLCGCVPIGSAVGAIPDIIADTGYILSRREPVMLESLINQALANPTEHLSVAAKARVATHYPIQRRTQELLDLVAQLTTKKKK